MALFDVRMYLDSYDNVLLNRYHSLIIMQCSTVGYATANDPTTNECYNKQFLSIKSGCYNEHRCYNDRGGVLSADIARA